MEQRKSAVNIKDKWARHQAASIKILPGNSPAVGGIRIAGVIEESIVDGPGIRNVIFVQGCHHRCYKCHSPETIPYSGGKLQLIDDIAQRITQNKNIDGITISGGEPFLQAESVYNLIRKIKELRDANIWIYSGYTLDELLKISKHNSYISKILNICDTLVDGQYVDKLRSLDLPYIGSSNQRIIDLNLQEEQT